MAASPSRRFVYRATTLLVAVLCLCSLFGFLEKLYGTKITKIHDNVLNVKYGTGNHRRNLGMTERECRAKFPGLMREIDESVSRGMFRLEKANDDYMGLVQGRIADGKVCYVPFKSLRDLLSIGSSIL